MLIVMPDDRTIGALRPESRPYPYLVIRWMAAVYGTAEIRIVASDDGLDPGRGITIVEPGHRDGAELDVSMRRRIIEAALVRSGETRLRMCVVFGDKDSVFVEPDGRSSHSRETPRGGLRLDRVTRHRRT